MTKQSESNEVNVSATGGWAMAAVTLLLVILGVYPAPVIEWVSAVAKALV